MRKPMDEPFPTRSAEAWPAEPGRDAAEDLPRLLGIALAALVLAAAAIVFAGAREAWEAGFGVAGGVLLLAGGALFLELRGHLGRASRHALRKGLRETVGGLTVPAFLSDPEGGRLAANSAWRARFGDHAPTRLIAPAELPPALAATAGQRNGPRLHAFRATVADRPRRITATRCGTDILWIVEDEAEAASPALPAGEEAMIWLLAEGLGAAGIGCAAIDRDDGILALNAPLADWLGVADAASLDLDLRHRLLDERSRDMVTADGRRLAKHLVEGPGDCRLAVLREVETPAESGAATDGGLREALFAAAPVGLAILDAAGRLVEFNRYFRRFTPDRNPEPGDCLVDYIADDERAGVAAHLAQILDGSEKPAPRELSFNTRPARTGQIVFTALPGRNPPRALAHIIDTTRHRSLEKQFVQAQKMQAVGQLAGGVAHDFNNLLTAIIGFCDLLLVRHGPGDQSFPDVMQIKQNANRAANLVRQLLAFSRQQTMRPRVLAITDVLADLSNLLRRLIGETIELKMIHGRDIGAVKVDQGQLEQVIINLAVNARDAMTEGGTLTIRTRAAGPDDRLVRHYSVMPPGHYVLIEVSDTGCGIPTGNLNKIFEPFFTTKSVGKGTGLGLSTVYGIIKQTGGFVFVESAPGEGATFRVYLPVHEVEEAPAKAAEPAETAAPDLTGRGTILLVEDEDAVRTFAARALVNKGYQVLQAASGEEAMEIVRNRGERIDLLISDVVMPNMDGPTLVAAAQQVRPDLRIIFISGYAEEAFRNTLGAGQENCAFLPKPFSLKQLAETVKTCLS